MGTEGSKYMGGDFAFNIGVFVFVFDRYVLGISFPNKLVRTMFVLCLKNVFTSKIIRELSGEGWTT